MYVNLSEQFCHPLPTETDHCAVWFLGFLCQKIEARSLASFVIFASVAHCHVGTNSGYHLFKLCDLTVPPDYTHWTWSVIENVKQCSYLKCSYLKMGSHGNAMAVSFQASRALAVTRT